MPKSSQPIYLFSDPSCQPLPEYNAVDAAGVLDKHGIPWRPINVEGLTRLPQRRGGILIFPYLDGELPEKTLNALTRFHGKGGSLLVLGDLPHRGRWYPLRNSHAWRWHLSRAYDDVSISSDQPGIRGLTEAGRQIIGKLPHPEFFRGRTFPGLRVVAFPPDRTYPLLQVYSRSHTQQSSAVVAVERECRRFLGARFAMIGFNGGEPRENVLGVYQRPWKYDPGLLTREWQGMEHLLIQLLRWLEPADRAAAIEAAPVSRAGAVKPATVLLRNLSRKPIVWRDLILTGGERRLDSWNKVEVLAGELCELQAETLVSEAGIHNLTLTGISDNDRGSTVMARAISRIYPIDAESRPVFGFSTYWAFQKPAVPREFKHFCRAMVDRGCQYLRANIPWEDVEPCPGRYDWRITDQLLAFARKEKLLLQFWMFPTTRGSGLADAGVPEWTLKEPAIDRDGNPGNFPSIWSPFYRTHYFAMITAFAKRYANHSSLDRFIIDFGNSDFPYGYYYYVNDMALFDYSPHEQAAFAGWLKETLDGDIGEAERLFGRTLNSFDEVPVPLAENEEAWQYYLEFRNWSVFEGTARVHSLIREHAPAKLPVDLPGHGLGSIADARSYFYETKARHWREERKFDPRYTAMHNAGERWGGEPWQVGGDYRQYDDALFQSVRLNADYFSIPGADLGSKSEEIARIGFIRRALAGATRRTPKLAVLDRIGWNDYRSVANLACRLDLPVDLLCAGHRFDFSCYRLLTMPDRDYQQTTGTGGGGGLIVPTDEAWYWLLRESVEKGLNLLVFPETCRVPRHGKPRTFLRQVLELTDIAYGPRRRHQLIFPETFGGGQMVGAARPIRGEGEEAVRNSTGNCLLLRRPMGKGAVWLAGWDNQNGSPDPAMNPERHCRIPDHTIVRLCHRLGLASNRLRTNNLFAWKELVRRENRDYLLLFSHCQKPLKETVAIRLARPVGKAVDLATNEQLLLSAPDQDGWQRLEISLHTRQGRYLALA